MADVTDEDVREALRDLGAECQTVERWMLDGKEAAKGFVDDGSWWHVRGPNRDDPTDRTEGEAADALAAVLRIRAALEMRPPEPKPPKPAAVPPREQVIAHLRSLPVEGLLELLREARVCLPWQEDDNERGAGPFRYLACIGGRHIAAVSCVDGGSYGAPDLEGERAAEDAAIAAGYRVPWRQT